MIVKVNYVTGATIWAKQLSYIYNTNNMYISKTVLNNDTAWSLMTPSLMAVTAPAILIKTDTNGDFIDAFKALNYDLSNCILLVGSFEVQPDSSFLIGATVTYLKGEFGVSPISYKDISFFMYDSLKSPVWVTSIDFFNKAEEDFGFQTSENIIYVSTSTNTKYYWLYKLNLTDGQLLISKWINSESDNMLFDYKSFKIVFVSKTLIFANTYQNLYVYDKNLLELK